MAGGVAQICGWEEGSNEKEEKTGGRDGPEWIRDVPFTMNALDPNASPTPTQLGNSHVQTVQPNHQRNGSLIFSSAR